MRKLIVLLVLPLYACAEKEAPPTITASVETRTGEAVYTEYCSQCHEGGVAKAPHKMFLEMLAPDAIYASMVDGIMQAQAEALDDQERRLVAEYLAKASLDDYAAPALPPRCSEEDAVFDFDRPPSSTGWGVAHNSNRYAADAGMDREDVESLELKWALAFPNALRARSEPGIAGGSVFVGSQDGTVYALNAKTGCLRWTFRASAEVRTSIIVSPWEAGDTSARPQLFFGDLLARAYSIDAQTGELIWSVKVDDHPNATITGAPTLFGERLLVPISSLEVTSAADPSYPCCTFRGAVMAIAADDGEVLWKQHTIEAPPVEVGKTSVGTPVLAPSGAPIWNSPSVDVDSGTLFVGTGENYSSPAEGSSDAIIAMDVETGDRRWIFQATEGDAWNVACMLPDMRQNCPEEDGPDFDFGAGTMVVDTDAGRLVVAGQKSGEAFGIDSETGELKWRNRLGRGGIQAGIHFGMAAMDDTVFVPISDFDDDQEHELPARPGMFALDAATGEVRWHTPHEDLCAGREHCDPGISAPATATTAAVFAGAMDGVLRAYDPATGEVIWSFDTAREFDALGGARGMGGSIGGGSGPVVRDGMLYQTSGYGMYFHMPGNVLLAFGPRAESSD
ncbi:MAG: PQQ-binding-like beta-propeller repeat protein [Woeseiaceae bacterium]|nr:PQQ-binding-like beta-propeller repeat protein [Woeseiaceae bacterium]